MINVIKYCFSLKQVSILMRNRFKKIIGKHMRTFEIGTYCVEQIRFQNSYWWLII